MKTLLEQLSLLLEYPEEHTVAHLDAALQGLREQCPSAAEALSECGRYLSDTPLWAVQEAYTRTFDLNPACSLDVGYYLFGEDYQRGVFMAHLRESQEELGMEEGRELPDHLPVLLRWMARVYSTPLYTDMAAECVVPVVRRMDACLSGGANPYRGVLQAVARVLEDDLSRRGIAIAERSFRAPDLAAPIGTGALDLEGVPILSPDAQPCGGIR